MSQKLIDNIFDYDSYRYVPQELKSEWKTLYNLYIGKYFEKQHEIYKIYPQNRIDFYNEENLRLDRIKNLCETFSDKVENLQPKYNSDVEYSNEIKKNLKKSINKILKFINNKKTIVSNKMETKQIPNIQDEEHFSQCYDLDKASSNKAPIIISIILILVIFYVTFYIE